MSYQSFSPRPGVTLGYHKTEATAAGLPGVIFLSGYMSDMTGAKATYLEAACRARGQSFVRFDYRGRPASSGRFEDFGIGDWAQDALDVLDTLTEGPQVLVGSSMGGWLSLLLALKRPARVRGLVLLAAAPDFTEEVWQNEFNDAQRREVADKGVIYIPSQYGAPYPFSAPLFEQGRQNLLLGGPIAIDCPVRLLHGKADADVPWQKSEKIKSLLTSKDVTITWVDDGDHRLSREEDMAVLDGLVAGISRKISAS